MTQNNRAEVSDALLPCPFCGADNAMMLGPTCLPETPYNTADRLFPIVRCGSCCAEVSGDNEDYRGKSAIAAWNRRTSPAQGGWVVKPLEWANRSSTGWFAPTAFGDYRMMVPYRGSDSPVELYFGSYSLGEFRNAGLNETGDGYLDTPKAAAQADYEHRIRSALSVSHPEPTSAVQVTDEVTKVMWGEVVFEGEDNVFLWRLDEAGNQDGVHYDRSVELSADSFPEGTKLVVLEPSHSTLSQSQPAPQPDAKAFGVEGPPETAEIRLARARLSTSPTEAGVEEPWRAMLAQAEADLTTEREASARLREALEPFATLAENEVLMDDVSDDTDDWFRLDGACIKVGHLRAALRELKGGE